MSARDFMNSGFKQNKFQEEEEADPRVGLVNLADVMLVFACGLMVALVAHYNVNLSPEVVELEGERTEITESELSELKDDTQYGSGSALRERGEVYEDPTTGQLYLIEKKPTDATGEQNDATGE